MDAPSSRTESLAGVVLLSSSQDRLVSVPALPSATLQLYVLFEEPFTHKNPGALIPRQRHHVPVTVFAAACALSVGGCSGDGGLVDLSEASEVRRIVVTAPAGLLQIFGSDDAVGIVGTHATRGLGARGPAKVHLDADGVMHIDVPCAQLLPCSLDLSLVVASTTEVVLDVGSGDVQVEGLERADIQLDRGKVRATVLSDLVVRIGQGSLEATTLANSHVQAVVASGDVDLSVPPGSWRVDAAAARLHLSGVAADQRAAGQLFVHAPSGSVRIVGSDALASR